MKIRKIKFLKIFQWFSACYVHTQTDKQKDRQTDTQACNKTKSTYFHLFIANVPKIGNDKTQISLTCTTSIDICNQ